MSVVLILKPSSLGLRALSHSKRFSSFLVKNPYPTLRISPCFGHPLQALSGITFDPLFISYRRLFPVRAVGSSPTKVGEEDEVSREKGMEDGALPSASTLPPTNSSASKDRSGEYPLGEFEIEEFGWWMKVMVKLRMLFALPWERVKKGSVLTMKLGGRITDQLTSRFSNALSLPQICKFIVSYIPVCREKEYYLACACGEIYAPPSAYVALYGLSVQASFLGGVFEKVGVEPQIQRIGKFKSIGDSLARKSISQENREMLTALIDDTYGNWLETISSTLGKTKEEVEDFINSGVYQVERLKENGWITSILYDDEVMSMLKGRLEQHKRKSLLSVDYRKYSRVRKWTVGMEGGGDKFAIIRASGSISRTRGPLSSPGSGIIAEQLIDKIRSVRESERYKAVILRIDSPGGDALASDLMWREIRLLAASKPVVASMSDVAASGGYYMAMAANTVIAESLTLTGSIGVVTGKFNLGKLYEWIGFNKEIISRGKYSELLVAEHRPFRPDEAELFEKSANYAYQLFRDKAAFSRSMMIEEMEEIAQGRVWTGKEAVPRGLVDAIGGFSRAVAIAKQKANIPEHRQVKLVEICRPSPSFSEILSGLGASLFGLERTMKEMLQDLTSYGDVQARIEGILFERMEREYSNPVFSFIKDYFSSF
ncbi:hypothetical protein HPP92_017961 [Vanilla planifolia]|uniref:Peptidase S49 domain-containing protein n=1 Tax=Vanilla planifolia TaxID=51239 RepID=A0A835Q906_VANPL|nr:hypothetical protein HPP92_017961 [Vanilla planifolia]